jgi:hypothetical protein
MGVGTVSWLQNTNSTPPLAKSNMQKWPSLALGRINTHEMYLKHFS